MNPNNEIEPKQCKEIMKICSRCGIKKDKAEFGKNKSTKDGLMRWCKKCRTIRKQFEEPKQLELPDYIYKLTNNEVNNWIAYLTTYRIFHPGKTNNDVDGLIERLKELIIEKYYKKYNNIIT
jgi:hypothetical protein